MVIQQKQTSGYLFIPVAAMSGITGSLYQQFAITVAVSVVFSSLNALTLSPALCSLLLRPKGEQKGLLAYLFGKFNRWFDKLTGSYIGITEKVAKNIKTGLLFILIMFIGLGALGKILPGGFMPDEDMGYLFVNMQLPDAASLQRTDEVAKKVEDILLKYEDIEYVTTAAGFSLLTGSYITNAGFLFGHGKASPDFRRKSPPPHTS